MPNIKPILNSLIVKGNLRDYLRKLKWMDAKLYLMLQSTLSMTEAEAESETSLLCKIVPHY